MIKKPPTILIMASASGSRLIVHSGLCSAVLEGTVIVLNVVVVVVFTLMWIVSG